MKKMHTEQTAKEQDEETASITLSNKIKNNYLVISGNSKPRKIKFLAFKESISSQHDFESH